MNEMIDRLLIRIILTIFICLILILYRYAHVIFYPSSRIQLLKKIYPSKNSSDTLHLFARLIGIGLVYSELFFSLDKGIIVALIDFLINASLMFAIYLASLFVLESIILNNFEYNDEVIKRKNFAYSITSFSIAIGTGYLLKNIITLSENSLVLMLFLWLFIMVLIGIASKTYTFFSKLPFTRLMIQKSLAVGFSYAGFFGGWCFLISSSLHHEIDSIGNYAIESILNLLLSIIIFPIFKKGLMIIFRIQDDLQSDILTSTTKFTKDDIPKVGYGIYEGAIFFAACFLTSIITGHIDFSNFYPES